MHPADTAFRRTISTRIDIAAPPERVWEILADFPRYPEWNPFFVAAEGVPEPGARVALRTRLFSARSRPRTFPVTVRAVTPCRELRWGGGLPVPRVMDGEHGFVLTPTASGTLLHHHETLRGAAIPLTGKLLRLLERRYHELNEALRARAER